jgi:hypothetical protein
LFFDIPPEISLVLADDRIQNIFCFSPVTLEGNQHRNFVPDELETFAVIGQWIGEDFPVGNVDHPAGTLVGIHPITNFQQRKLEETCIYYIPGVVADLDAVPDFERAAQKDEDPASHVGDRIAERDDYPGRYQAKIRYQVGEIVHPDQTQQRKDQKIVNVCCGFSPQVANAQIIPAPVSQS